MHFTKVSGATAALLISMISASPIHFSDVSSFIDSHPHPTGSLGPMIPVTDKTHPTAMEPHPTAFSAHKPEFTALPGGGFENNPHHSFLSGAGSSVDVETATAALPSATTVEDDSLSARAAEETTQAELMITPQALNHRADMLIPQAVPQSQNQLQAKTGGSGTSSAGGGGMKQRDASASSGGSAAKGGSSGNGNGSSGGVAENGGAKKKRDAKVGSKGADKTGGSEVSTAGAGGE